MNFLDFSGLSQNRGPSDSTKEGMLQSQRIYIQVTYVQMGYRKS